MVISGILTREIDEKRSRILDNPDYYLRKSKIDKSSFRQLCDVYSFWLENPQLRRKILTQIPEGEEANLRQLAREGVKNIKNAWNYLNAEGGNNFLESLNPHLVIGTGKLIDPIKNSNGYRIHPVLGFLPRYTAPNALKVPELVEKACEDVRNSDYHPVEAAAAIHLDIAGIQPFNDGNKRTARLIQDRILHAEGLPPAIIPTGERELYIDLFEDALMGKRDGNYRAQRPFFDYIGGKVNCALDDILGDLK